MESLKSSITQLMETFDTRMSEFENRLQKAPTASSNPVDLATEFTLFRTFIGQALTALQQQVSILVRAVDGLEMRTRQKILLFHGVPEETKEDPVSLVTKCVQNHCQFTDFEANQIVRCHRMGQNSNNKCRPLIVKFSDRSIRRQVWAAKTKLKGSGITVSEFLTRARHEVFLAARDKFGVNKCWTHDGAIYVLTADGERRRIMSVHDIKNIGQHDMVGSVREASAPPVTVRSAMIRSKRTLAKK